MASQLGMGTVSMAALKVLYFKAKKEAFVLAFQKVMVILVTLFVLVLYPLSRMKRSVVTGKLPDAH
jgi:hypothetical protein